MLIGKYNIGIAIIYNYEKKESKLGFIKCLGTAKCQNKKYT